DEILDRALDSALGGLEAVVDAPLPDSGGAADAVARLEHVLRGAVHVLVDQLPAVTLLLRVRGNTDVERRALTRRRAFDRRITALVAEAQAEGALRSDIDAAVVARLTGIAPVVARALTASPTTSSRSPSTASATPDSRDPVFAPRPRRLRVGRAGPRREPGVSRSGGGELLRDESQDVVGRDELVVLVLQHRVPAHLAVLVGLPRRDLLGGELDADLVAGGHRGHEAQVLQPGVREHGPGSRVDEEPRRPRHQQVAVGHASGEERVRRRRRLVHVRVERVARERRERLDVVEGDGARGADDLIADAQLRQRLPEGVHAVVGVERAGRGPLVPDAGERGHHLRGALHRGALHVVQHRPDAAELLAAAGATGAAVHEVRERGAVAGRAAGVVAVEEEYAAVVRGDPRGQRRRDLRVVRRDAGDERAAAAGHECRRLVQRAVAEDAGDGAERLDLVHGGARRIGEAQEHGRHERAVLRGALAAVRAADGRIRAEHRGVDRVGLADEADPAGLHGVVRPQPLRRRRRAGERDEVAEAEVVEE
ncbi:unnamed protein product, partial [Penicillium discolor]